MHSPYAASINNHFSKLLKHSSNCYIPPTQYMEDQENTNQNSSAVKNSYKTLIRIKGFGAATERCLKSNLLS